MRTGIELNYISDKWMKNHFCIGNMDRGYVPNAKYIIRDHLKSLEDGEYKWQYLQGQVYGNRIHHAELFSGVANFLLHCKRRHVEVRVISHKTEFGHHDESRTPLRKAAMEWLRQQGLFSDDFGILPDNIFFLSTRKEKVAKIAELKCDYFIDDLAEVFEETGFPENTKRLLYSSSIEKSVNQSFDSWYAINAYFFDEIEDNDVAAYAEKVTAKRVDNISVVVGRGNNRVYKIELNPDAIYAGKLYSDSTIDPRPRLETEFTACQFIINNSNRFVPTAHWKDDNLNFALYEWLEGRAIKETSFDDVDQALIFIRALKNMSRKGNAAVFKGASAACFCGKDIEKQIYGRYRHVHGFSGQYPKLKDFLECQLYPAIREVLFFCKKNWPTDFNQELKQGEQVLSPSDFGFHNAIRTESGLRFVDLEYFGWDDPVKLTCDFLLHPGMDLSNELKQYWANNMIALFSNDPFFKPRLNISFSLHGLCWCLIILNEFCTDDMERRKFAGTKVIHITQKQDEQLQKSKHLLDFITRSYNRGFPYE